MNRPINIASQHTGKVKWDIYYFDKHKRLCHMERELPCGMSKDGIRDYIGRMGYEIDKAISDVDCYTY